MTEIKYLTLKKAAEILSISSRTLANLAKSGQISAYRLPSASLKKARYRFKQSDIEAFMEGNKFISINLITKNAFQGNKARIDVQRIKNYLTSNSH